MLIAGTLAPQGTLERVEGGWILNGRWQFGSGCDHSPWLLIAARRTSAEADPNAAQVFHVMVPAADIEIDDTWYTLGMRGTGSKDLVAKGVFVPAHRALPTYPLFVGSSPHATSPVVPDAYGQSPHDRRLRLARGADGPRDARDRRPGGRAGHTGRVRYGAPRPRRRASKREEYGLEGEGGARG